MAEYRKKGGNTDVDVSYQWLAIMFESNDHRLKQIGDAYKSGALLSGELKSIAIEKINAFLKDHQIKREEARDKLPEFLIKD
ncbi:MAG: Tryptophan--tRNA ligase [Promethearchaeota archaeon CR_4]|nr:MAG: Tryptophan--tRNA ligase [Candidatus Lokiarchaeota archaeon CR_4]